MQWQLDTTGVDQRRIEEFYDDYTAFTWRFTAASRRRKLDSRLREAGLNSAEKLVLLQHLSPRATDGGIRAITDPRIELRLERLLLSIPPEQLAAFKFTLDYDGDYKDLEEYLYHDIDDEAITARILAHFARAPSGQGIKLLTDVDDTLFANLIDKRYPKGVFYPGLSAFQQAIVREPFTPPGLPITLLSARPNPLAGVLEEMSLEGLREKSAGRLLPSGLSGDVGSSLLGTLQTWLRANSGRLGGYVPSEEEDEIGLVKWRNFRRFSAIYPDYRYVFCGDSGQADALTAQLMLEADISPGAERVITTFIHDLRSSADDANALSASFRRLPVARRVDEHSPTGRGGIVHRNYVHAAIIAYLHHDELQLIDAPALARITRTALEEIDQLDQEAANRVRPLYRQDTRSALALLLEAEPVVEAMGDDVRFIQQRIGNRV